jgi:hypothetical protein
MQSMIYAMLLKASDVLRDRNRNRDRGGINYVMELLSWSGNAIMFARQS